VFPKINLKPEKICQECKEKNKKKMRWRRKKAGVFNN